MIYPQHPSSESRTFGFIRFESVQELNVGHPDSQSECQQRYFQSGLPGFTDQFLEIHTL